MLKYPMFAKKLSVLNALSRRQAALPRHSQIIESEAVLQPKPPVRRASAVNKSGACAVRLSSTASVVRGARAVRLSSAVSPVRGARAVSKSRVGGPKNLSQFDFRQESLRGILRGLSAAESTLTKNRPITLVQSTLTKTLDLKSSRINTYKKTGGEGSAKADPSESPRQGELSRYASQIVELRG